MKGGKIYNEGAREWRGWRKGGRGKRWKEWGEEAALKDQRMERREERRCELLKEWRIKIFNEEWKGGKKGKADDGRNGGKNL
jgi:hypothetical protein